MRIWENGARSDPKDDLNLLMVNLYPLHQGTQDGLAGFPFQVVKPVSNARRKVGHLPNDQTELALLSGGLRLGVCLGFQVGDSLVSAV